MLYILPRPLVIVLRAYSNPHVYTTVGIKAIYHIPAGTKRGPNVRLLNKQNTANLLYKKQPAGAPYRILSVMGTC